MQSSARLPGFLDYLKKWMLLTFMVITDIRSFSVAKVKTTLKYVKVASFQYSRMYRLGQKWSKA